MNFSPELLLISSVGVVGVLHTIVPDHWVPIALIARQRGWSSGETARAALTAGIGHVVSTLIIASVIWFAGVAVAAKFGHFIDTAASVALIGFGDFVMARVTVEEADAAIVTDTATGMATGMATAIIYLFYLARSTRGSIGPNRSGSTLPAASSSYRF